MRRRRRRVMSAKGRLASAGGDWRRASRYAERLHGAGAVREGLDPGAARAARRTRRRRRRERIVSSARMRTRCTWRARVPTRCTSLARGATRPAARGARARMVGRRARTRCGWRADSTARVASAPAAPKSAKAARADSIARVRAKVRADSLKLIALQTDSAATRRLPGSLLPGCRVVAYYGNPMSKRMGILGEIKPDSMLARLAKQAAAYAAVDTGRPVLPALELIATVAQAGPGKSGLYRARMPDTLIARVMGWAEAHHYLVILDIQTGRSTMAAEMVPLMKYLAKPYVHLALDPEFSIGTKQDAGEGHRAHRCGGRERGVGGARDARRLAQAAAQDADRASLHDADAVEPSEDQARPARADRDRHGWLRRAASQVRVVQGVRARSSRCSTRGSSCSTRTTSRC